jgi:acyl-CoA synthetase (NDP forming)
MLRSYGINTPKGAVAKTAQEAYDVAQSLGELTQQIMPFKPYRY